MSVCDHLCADCQRCPACGRSAWCEGDRILVVPCEHHGYCGDCNINECRECQEAFEDEMRMACDCGDLDTCIRCRRKAEHHMAHTGEYDPHADPFYRPEAKNPAYSERLPVEVNPGTFVYPSDPRYPKDSA